MRRGVAALVGALLAASAGQAGAVVFGERRYDYEPADVLPGAAEFVRKDTYWEGYGAGHAAGASPLGYVFLTDDLVDVPGYSGHTLNSLVGMDPHGKITGVKIVRHAEPIVLIGLPEQVIHDFVAQYVGKDVRDRIVISDAPRADYVGVDAISGATVTAVALNASILEAARSVARTVGIVRPSEVRTRQASDVFEPMTWDDLEKAGAIGRLVVAGKDVGLAGTAAALDLRLTVLDPQAIGRNLLGDRYWKVVRERLAENGGSALFIGATGPVSFKGAGFARGGIFDRFSLEQGDQLFVFKDVDYVGFTDLPIEGAPDLREGGIFFLPLDTFDPTASFTFRLTIPYRIAEKRSYGTFLAEYELPARFVSADAPFWVTRWRDSAPHIVGFVVFLAAVAVVFALRQRLLRQRKLLHFLVGAVAAGWVGLLLKAQPSTTQILTAANAAVRRTVPIEIFLSEPLIFLFWIVIGVSLVVWGRGFFCGWLCPYGSLLEVLTSLWGRVAPPRLLHWSESWDPGPAWKAGKYVTFLVILAVALVNLPAAEALDEVEPFKTFILRLARPSAFVVYFVVVTVASVVVHRFFCRVLCPLGGALAITGARPLLPLSRYDRCSTCKICYKGCAPKAISHETGRIDYRECLQCWDCQATGQDEAVCPALIVAKRDGIPPTMMAGVALLVTLVAVPAGARTWTTSPATLADVLANSADGDTVRLAPGVYEGPVVVAKRLVLQGAPGAIVDAGGRGHAVIVSAPAVRVEGLTLRGCTRDLDESGAGIRIEQAAADVHVEGNRVEGCRFGIWINGSARANVIGNEIAGLADEPRNDRGDCVHLWSADEARIEGNTLTACRDGVYMELSTRCAITGNTITGSRYSVHTMWCDDSAYDDNHVSGNLVGLALMFSKRIEATGNVLYANLTHGILLTQVTRSVVVDNVIVGNTKGLFIYNALYNTVRGNFVARNGLGLHYWGGAEENAIQDNTFMANEIQVKFVAARDQEWPGNYWSDYVGWDADGDGHGDAPYRSNTFVDALLWEYPTAKLLLSSPALLVLGMAEREFPVISVPKGIDPAPRMTPSVHEWAAMLERYPGMPPDYYGTIEKLPHVPGEHG